MICSGSIVTENFCCISADEQGTIVVQTFDHAVFIFFCNIHFQMLRCILVSICNGLFKIVRCPNYLGEMIFWTGVLLSGANILSGVGQWAVALTGYIGIIFVMFSGARRLELRQNRNYGADPEYQAYVKSVPILLPFVPLYSVEKYKFLVA